MGGIYENDKFKLSVEDNDMSARLMLAPSDKDTVYTEEMVLSFLLANGIKMGVDKDKLNQYIAQACYYEEFVVAQGKIPVDGENGHYEMKFDTSSEIKPNIREDGSVDYLNTKLFEEINVGDVIAVYIPATSGTFGFTIRGKFLTPKKGRELSPLKGRGFDLSEDGKTYISNMKGKIEYKYGEINISEVYDFMGDLDHTHSHIRFSGDVRVHGDVAGGMIVDALGNVEIDGHVEGAVIRSGKNIVLKKGVQGAGRANIEAKGSIYGQFFEDSTISAGENIEVNYLLNCSTYARGKVNVRGRQGVILGGITHGVLGVEAHNVGNASELPTVIRIGASEEIMEQYAQAADNIKKIDDELKVLESGIARVSILKESGEYPEHEEAYTKMLQAKIIKNAEKKKYLEKRKELFQLISQSRYAYFGAHGDVFSGVEIIFDSVKKKLVSRYSNTIFKVMDGSINILPMD